MTPYFIIACIAIRALLAPGTSSRLESAFSIMKLLSSTTHANSSSDRVVLEFIIRQAQEQVGREKSDKTRYNRHQSLVNKTINTIDPDNLVDVFSKECPDGNFGENDVINEDVDESVHIDWFPIPCERDFRIHRRRYGKLPGLWNKAFQEVDVIHEEGAGEQSEFELAENCFFQLR